MIVHTHRQLSCFDNLCLFYYTMILGLQLIEQMAFINIIIYGYRYFILFKNENFIVKIETLYASCGTYMMVNVQPNFEMIRSLFSKYGLCLLI